MFENTFYHQTIRNTIAVFGALFSNIKIERKNSDGVVEQIIQVPIAYSNKEKWILAIDSNQEGERGIYNSLPRLGFEIDGYSYDNSRKLAKSNTVYCQNDDGKKQAFVPTPWNLDINLYFATKTQEDALQILEQILPTFSPEYTISVKSLVDLNITQDIPIILNGVSVEDNYEGDLRDRRMVVHYLKFTAKLNLYGPVTQVGVIKQVEVNVDDAKLDYVATGTIPGEEITESWMFEF